ncbi:Gamma-glutamyl phosphate reductase, partial [hydrothermal vent metagenome]
MENKKLEADIVKMTKKARVASRQMALISTTEKNKALRVMARAIVAKADYLIKENKKDLKEAQTQDYSKALVDRLVLNEKRIKGMATCLLDTAKIKDPVGEVLKKFKPPNGLLIEKVRVPIGVIGIIYESRPNVTSDCIGLCLKSGNAVILKGGKEAFHSNKAIFSILQKALKTTKIPVDAIQLVMVKDRQAVNVLLKQYKNVDLIVPRGGEGLIRFVTEHSLIPVVKHDKGLCHTYVSDKADLKMAGQICFNAKVQRPGVCNAMETLLVHKKIAAKFLPEIIRSLQEAGVEVRGCRQTRKIVSKGVLLATAQDWDEEYLEMILSIKVVDNMQEAVDHINIYG